MDVRNASMSLLVRAVLAFLGVKLTNLIINVIAFPVLRVPAGVSHRPTVSLLVPMRNEQQRLNATLPSIAAQPVAELLILDDCSTDDSVARAQSLTTTVEHARVVAGRPRPHGWAGKTWACHQLGELATGDVLIFCDADVHLAAGAVSAILAELARQDADLLSVFPRQQTRTMGEHLLIPLIDDVLLCFLPFPLLGTNVASAATANGSLLAFPRAAYVSLSGFSAVRGAVTEDVALARHVRRSGLRLGLVLGGSLVETRMYTSYRGAFIGLGRGLRAVAGGSRSALAAAAAWNIIVYTVPLIVLLGRRQRRWALPLVAAVVERLVVEAKSGRRQWWQASLTPLGPLALLPAVLQAMRREQRWRDRVYET